MRMGLVFIGLPHIEIELKPEYLMEFVAFKLGENGLPLFSKEERLAIASKMIDSLGMLRMSEDTMALFVGSGFDFFIPVSLKAASAELSSAAGSVSATEAGSSSR